MRRVRGALLLLALGLMLFALARPVVEVQSTPEGESCGSAWRSAHRDLSRGGERTRAEIERALTACEIPGDRALRQAAVAGAAGLALLLGLAVWRVPSRRTPLADPLGGR